MQLFEFKRANFVELYTKGQDSGFVRRKCGEAGVGGVRQSDAEWVLRNADPSVRENLSWILFLPLSATLHIRIAIDLNHPTMPLAKPSNTDAPVHSLFSLKGKTAAVTGGVRGIGLAASQALAEAGANVAILYSSTKDADAIAARIASSTGATVKAYKASVENKDEITSVINTIAKDFGGLDIVVANAGIANHRPAEDYTEEQWRHIMSINLDGAFYTAQAAGVIFKAQGHGNVIFTASVSAILVNVPQKQAAYNASKAAVVQLARCLSVEWVDFARVNCISPGFIDTDMLDVHPREWREKWLSMVPAGRLCDPGELKGAYVFLASNASSYMTGANLVIDGGYTLP